MAPRPRECRRRLRWFLAWSATLVLAALILSFRLVEDIGIDRSPADRFVVTRVRDGDTMELAGGDQVRLLSIDTPEAGEPLYEEACRFLRELTEGRSVRIEFAGRRRDKYGRLLGYVYLDSMFVNKAIVQNGLGYVYLFKDTELDRPETGQLLQAQRVALDLERGLWGIERVAEDYYISRAGSFRFHRPGCRHARGWSSDQCRRFADRGQALYEGLSPCRTCKP